MRKSREAAAQTRKGIVDAASCEFRKYRARTARHFSGEVWGIQ